MGKKKVRVAKAKAAEVVAYEIRVAHESYCTDSYRSEEQYGEWREHNEVSVGETFTYTETTANDGRWYDMMVPFKPEADRPYYLIYGVYSTGDSFGSRSGVIHFVGLFENEEDATEIAKLIEKIDGYQYSINYKGQDYHIPWTGYFESLERLEMKPIRLGDSGRKTFFSSGRWDYER